MVVHIPRESDARFLLAVDILSPDIRRPLRGSNPKSMFPVAVTDGLVMTAEPEVSLSVAVFDASAAVYVSTML